MSKINTIDYYNQNAAAFVSGTVDVSFSETQDRFLNKLQKGARILDFGCGSGRDTKYFLEKGYSVDAVDGSETLCRYATQFTGIPVKQMLFQDLDAKQMYDGIWACSSILHLCKSDLKSVLSKMIDALRENGIIYTSFKYGTFEGERNGRYFTDFTLKSFEEFIKDVDKIAIKEHWVTSDVRPGRSEEKWLNIILRII